MTRMKQRTATTALIAVMVGLCLVGAVLAFTGNDQSTADQVGASAFPGASPSRSATPAPVPYLAPAPPAGDKLYLGVDSDASRVSDFDREVGIKQPAILGGYTAMNGSLGGLLQEMSTPGHAIPMLSWQVDFTGDQIVDGKLDSYLKAQAAAVLAYAQPVFIRPDWEMNGNWSPWDYPQVTPAEYVAAWRHIVDIFNRVGATNAAFVWCPNVGDFTPDPVSDWYPGSNYVDWIGVDAYPANGSTKTVVEPDGLNQIAGYAASLGKPMMLAEWGETLPGTDSDWVFDLVFQWADRYPATVKALIYFNYGVPTRDHLLDDLPVGAKSFAALVKGDQNILFSVPVVPGLPVRIP
jgi:Glycosyl hydrolase family 26